MMYPKKKAFLVSQYSSIFNNTTIKKPMRKALLRTKTTHPHVWKHLLLEYVPSVVDAGGFHYSHGPSARPYVVQSRVLVLEVKGFKEGRLEHLHHLGIAEVIDDVLENVLVGNKAQRTEHNDARNVLQRQEVEARKKIETWWPHTSFMYGNVARIVWPVWLTLEETFCFPKSLTYSLLPVVVPPAELHTHHSA
jgi:hypothetical protein